MLVGPAPGSPIGRRCLASHPPARAGSDIAGARVARALQRDLWQRRRAWQRWPTIMHPLIRGINLFHPRHLAKPVGEIAPKIGWVSWAGWPCDALRGIDEGRPTGHGASPPRMKWVAVAGDRCCSRPTTQVPGGQQMHPCRHEISTGSFRHGARCPHARLLAWRGPAWAWRHGLRAWRAGCPVE